MSDMEDMTFVRCNYPHSFHYQLVGWVIYDKPPTEDTGSLVIGRGETIRAAWADARKKIVDKYAAGSSGAVKAPANDCDMGVGCDEAGRCYAAAMGEPHRCSRDTSLQDQARELLGKELSRSGFLWNPKVKSDSLTDPQEAAVRAIATALSTQARGPVTALDASIIEEASQILAAVLESGVPLPANWRHPIIDELSGIAAIAGGVTR